MAPTGVVKASSGDSLLSVFAVHRTDGTLTVLAINKSPTATKSASIALTGFTPAASANVYSYGIPQDNAAKNILFFFFFFFGSTDVATASMLISGATFSASFAPYSATVISLSWLPSMSPHLSLTAASQSCGAGGRRV